MESPREVTSFNFPVTSRSNTSSRGHRQEHINVHNVSVASTKSNNDVRNRSSFEQIKEWCYQRRTLYEDVDFPANDRSLFYCYKPNFGPIVWRRPFELVKNPQFSWNGMSRFDILQGKLGDCWLVSAFTCLTLAPNLIKRCIPEGQSFNEKYCGVFHFRFWRYGEWIDVVIDDKLPTFNGELIYMRSSDKSEFWPALFEKAYAKFYGSYENISGSMMKWSLQDITGGITETYQIYENPKMIQRILDVSMINTSILGAYISTNMTMGQRRRLSNGLVTGHAYVITGYAEIPVKIGRLILIRLRSPWGRFEWNGAWSDGSPHWNALNEDIKRKLVSRQSENGEFWMSFVDFSNIFTVLEVCHLNPECWKCEPSLQHRKSWAAAAGHREWRRGYNAGGAASSPLLAFNNQFYLEVPSTCCVVISLMQKYRLCTDDKSFISCGCLIYQIPKEQSSRLTASFFRTNRLYATTGFRKERENVGFFILPTGCYVILPVTSIPGTEAKYYLRIFTSGQCKMMELDDEDCMTLVQLQEKLTDVNGLHTYRKRFFNFAKQNEIDVLGLQRLLQSKMPSHSHLCCFSETEAFHLRSLNLPLTTCKAAIAIADTRMNGRLNFEEFDNLLSRFIQWQAAFYHQVSNGEIVMDTYALRTSLAMLGITLSNKTTEAVVVRFATKEVMTLEGFVSCLTKLVYVHQRFRHICKEKRGKEPPSLQETVNYLYGSGNKGMPMQENMIT